MAAQEMQFYKLVKMLRKLEEMAGRTFADTIAAGSTDPMTELANTIATTHDGEGYVYGIHADNALVAFIEDNSVRPVGALCIGLLVSV